MKTEHTITGQLARECQPAAPAYILTLQAQDSPPLLRLLSSLNDAGFNPHVVGGTIGGELSAREYFQLAANCRARYGNWLSPGEIGCTLGHMSIYREIIASDEDISFVFEDDVDLARLPAVSLQIIDIMSAANIHFLHLGGQDGLESRKKIFGKPSPIHAEVFEIDDVSLSFLKRTCGYAITKAAARNILMSSRNLPVQD